MANTQNATLRSGSAAKHEKHRKKHYTSVSFCVFCGPSFFHFLSQTFLLKNNIFDILCSSFIFLNLRTVFYLNFGVMAILICFLLVSPLEFFSINTN
jgi:hypothetical protein